MNQWMDGLTDIEQILSLLTSNNSRWLILIGLFCELVAYTWLLVTMASGKKSIYTILITNI